MYEKCKLLIFFHANLYPFYIEGHNLCFLIVDSIPRTLDYKQYWVQDLKLDYTSNYRNFSTFIFPTSRINGNWALRTVAHQINFFLQIFLHLITFNLITGKTFETNGKIWFSTLKYTCIYILLLLMTQIKLFYMV